MRGSNILWRIDDRLIHGQIIIGWCGQLPIQKLVVCDKEIASTEWEKNLLLMAAPPEISTLVLTPEELAVQLDGWIQSDEIIMILVKSVNLIQQLTELGLQIQKVNIGGIHFQEGRTEYLPFLFLNPEEVSILKALMSKGIEIECQDLPNAPTYNLANLLGKKG